MKDALDIHRVLLEHEWHHHIVRLRRPILTADELPSALSLPRRRCLVVRMYEASGQLFGFLVGAGRTPPTASVLDATGVRDARPAEPDHVNRVTDYAAGFVAPLLLPGHVRLFIDRSTIETVAADEAVYTATGDSGTALGIRLRDLLELTGATARDLATRDIQVPDVPGAVRPGAVPLVSGVWGSA